MTTNATAMPIIFFTSARLLDGSRRCAVTACSHLASRPDVVDQPGDDAEVEQSGRHEDGPESPKHPSADTANQNTGDDQGDPDSSPGNATRRRGHELAERRWRYSLAA
jgi:hypothetical protein